MNREKRIEILKILQKEMPNVTTELEHKNLFELLLAVVLSAQTTDKSVNLATREIFPIANTPDAILALGPEKFQEMIKNVGLYRGKTKYIMELCKILKDQYGGKVPEDIEELRKLPGVGRKTASVVMNVAFDAPFIGVDTHVFRVANRTGYAKGKTPQEVQNKMEKYTPAQYRPKAHQWFLRIGRYICKARIPECWRCPIERLCEYKEKVLVQPEPKRAKKLKHPEAELEVPITRDIDETSLLENLDEPELQEGESLEQDKEGSAEQKSSVENKSSAGNASKEEASKAEQEAKTEEGEEETKEETPKKAKPEEAEPEEAKPEESKSEEVKPQESKPQEEEKTTEADAPKEEK